MRSTVVVVRVSEVMTTEVRAGEVMATEVRAGGM